MTSRTLAVLTTASLLFALAAEVAGCGTMHPTDSRAVVVSQALSRWPSAADYTTIEIAASVRDRALFHEHNWRRKSFAAQLALRTLLTVRIAAGPCASYVTRLYGNLRDLQDAYPGEDWRPLVAVVRRDPPLRLVCRPPSPRQRSRSVL